LQGLVGLGCMRASGSSGATPFLDASVAVDYEHPGRVISDDFIGLSYESAVLAAPDYFSAATLSISGLLRGLGRRGVLRIGGNSSEDTLWRGPSEGLEGGGIVITPAAID